MITQLLNTVKEITTVNITVLNLDLLLLVKTKLKLLIFQIGKQIKVKERKANCWTKDDIY